MCLYLYSLGTILGGCKIFLQKITLIISHGWYSIISFHFAPDWSTSLFRRRMWNKFCRQWVCDKKLVTFPAHNVLWFIKESYLVHNINIAEGQRTHLNLAAGAAKDMVFSSGSLFDPISVICSNGANIFEFTECCGVSMMSNVFIWLPSNVSNHNDVVI